MKKIRSQTGITMIEVLISILIFSFGMLGLAGLQTAALRYQQSGWARAAVARLSSEISDRVRANLDGARSGSYQFTGAYPYPAAATPPAATINCQTNICNAAQLAQYDLNQWIATAVRDMPGGWGNIQSVTYNNGAQQTVRTISITIYWNDKESTDTAAVCSGGLPITNRNCCPTAVAAGVRCLNTVFVP